VRGDSMRMRQWLGGALCSARPYSAIVVARALLMGARGTATENVTCGTHTIVARGTRQARLGRENAAACGRWRAWVYSQELCVCLRALVRHPCTPAGCHATMHAWLMPASVLHRCCTLAPRRRCQMLARSRGPLRPVVRSGPNRHALPHRALREENTLLMHQLNETLDQVK
jgi:hypothetical protein